MNLEQYVKDAIRTESQIDKVVLQHPEIFLFALKTFIAAGNILDCVKKNVFYGKDTEDEMFKWCQAIRYYQFQLEDIDPELELDPRVFHALIGIATESSELMEALEKSVHGEQLDYVNVLEEFGDVNWYEAIGIDAMNGDFDNILNTNIEKLRKRFPEKFTSEHAIERDVEAERATLEDTLNDRGSNQYANPKD
jgi:NTP pyrophosphatase (non-canonical NTP hydrolase)